MSTATVLIPSVGGTRHTLYDATSRADLYERLNHAVTASPPHTLCAGQYAAQAAEASALLRIMFAQGLATTNPAVNGYRVASSWAGGCWFTDEQMTRLAAWTRAWAALQASDCAEVGGADEPDEVVKSGSGIYLGTRSGASVFGPATTFAAKERDVETKFVATMSVLGQSDDEGAISDDEGWDSGDTYAPPGGGQPMSAGMKLALGAGALLAVVLLVRGLR